MNTMKTTEQANATQPETKVAYTAKAPTTGGRIGIEIKLTQRKTNQLKKGRML
jgi:hypothetical protein